MGKRFSLLGIKANAFSVLAYVIESMRKCGKIQNQIDDYEKDATSKNYDHLLYVSQKMINELNEL